MQVVLYECLDDERRIGKTLQEPLTLNGTLKTGADLTRPVILAKGSFEDLAKKNYAKIGVFGRCYFVRNISVVANGLTAISLEVDVLESYKDSLLQCGCRVIKSENPEDYKLQKVLLDTNQTKKIEFENPFNFEGINVMVCVNGARAQG